MESRTARSRPKDTTLQGTIERVTFSSDETHYAVLRLRPEGGAADPDRTALFRPDHLTVVGHLPEPSPGVRLRLFGSWTTHPSHGRQFQFENFERLPPLDKEGLVRYFQSKAFQGVGATLAKRIVETLGNDALEIIADDPRRLREVRGLSGKVADGLAERVRDELSIHRTHAFLRGLGLGPVLAARAARRLGAECEAKLRADPYELARLPGVGFATADQIALKLDVPEDGTLRCRAAMFHLLGAAANDGHSFVPREHLAARVNELLEAALDEQTIEDSIAELEQARDIVREDAAEIGTDGEAIYLSWIAASERQLAANLATLAAQSDVRPLAKAAELERFEDVTDMDLHPSQREAVLGLLSHAVSLLTGGPGVGKTTIVRAVVQLAETAGAKVALASPTGRAAKRLAEATGHEATTIHRLLGWDPAEGRFVHDADRPLGADLVIIDEISMMDVVLAHHLVKAVKLPTRLVFVGDPDQLPSVGPGNVLHELIESARLPVFRLTQIFRQQGGSLIVENAHRLLAGEAPRLPERGDHEADFFFFPADEAHQCAQRVVEVVTERIPQRFGLDWFEDVQVLAPMYKGECGVDALNERLRAALGTPGREVQLGERRWRTGDRVIQTRNDYEKHVYNGDMGRIEQIDAEGGVIVRFQEQETYYKSGELSDLQAAFAITVHRSQGSEYPAVVIPLVPGHFMMLQRNLLYTAFTRARRLLVLVGSQRALRMAIDNTEQKERRSALGARLIAALGDQGSA